MNFLTLTTIILSSILVLILIAVIIWRIYLKITKKVIYKSNNIGHTTRETIDKLRILNSLNNAFVLSNILVKNPFSKNKYTLFSGIVICKSKIYVLSDLIKDTQNKIEINDNGIYVLKNKKWIKKDKWETNWLNQMSGWLNRRFKNNYEVVIFIDENLNLEQIDNQTRYRCMNINELNEEILENNDQNLHIEKVIDIFLKNNLFKGNSNK
ncbi:hypothetical protein NPA08_04500 [Mycoplasmopsis citelli]|uniref:hypothetical protein n=1 Tax=Mycoplasmopsis citelli TaxID=171281 RepID=UPI002113C1A3|nr:hypothetical protein [Mycoplasmopsis citelli]UUD36181.1 hypothetical protein NPA08_04500 [Mycoplasmopsis citelli]